MPAGVTATPHDVTASETRAAIRMSATRTGTQSEGVPELVIERRAIGRGTDVSNVAISFFEVRPRALRRGLLDSTIPAGNVQSDVIDVQPVGSVEATLLNARNVSALDIVATFADAAVDGFERSVRDGSDGGNEPNADPVLLVKLIRASNIMTCFRHRPGHGVCDPDTDRHIDDRLQGYGMDVGGFVRPRRHRFDEHRMVLGKYRDFRSAGLG